MQALQNMAEAVHSGSALASTSGAKSSGAGITSGTGSKQAHSTGNCSALSSPHARPATAPEMTSVELQKLNVAALRHQDSACRQQQRWHKHKPEDPHVADMGVLYCPVRGWHLRSISFAV